ncbi:MAG TPA: hypothetical protein VK540_31705 [Polyangiaceae bacterium]|nr:hypothetical protein [Polyangiaceae bacterium]
MKRSAVLLLAAVLVVATPAGADLRISELKWSGVRASMPLFRAVVAGDFNGDLEARFAMRVDPIVYKPRLAFYRVATALGSGLVPRSEVYQVRLAEILRALAHDPHGMSFLRSGVTVNNDGTVTVLITEPVVGGHDVDIVSGAEVAAWRRWAEGREAVPPDRQDLVLAYVEALVLDFVTATVGRRLVTVDSSKSSLYLRENSGAFNERADPRGLDSILTQLKRVNRFPKRLIDRLRAFDRAEADSTLRAGAFTSWLVATRPLSEMMERRRAIVSLVDARLAELGEAGLVLVP